MSTEEEIKAVIEGHITKNRGSYASWYVGVSADPQKSLFGDHGVRQKGDAWIFRQAQTSSMAQSVEKYFSDHGADGSVDTGDDDSKFVYAFKKYRHTMPRSAKRALFLKLQRLFSRG